MNECRVWPTSHTYSHHIKIKLGSVAVATTSFDHDIFKPSQVHSFSAIFITSMLASKPPRGCSARPSFCGSRAPLIMTSIGHCPSWNSSLDRYWVGSDTLPWQRCQRPGTVGPYLEYAMSRFKEWANHASECMSLMPDGIDFCMGSSGTSRIAAIGPLCSLSPLQLPSQLQTTLLACF